MNRFDELLEKRKNLTADIYEEEELIELSKTLPKEELDKIDGELLTYSFRLSQTVILDKLDEMIKLFK